MISQFFASQRGDNIVFRDYRGQKGSTEIFFRKVKFWKEYDGQEEAQAPPVFVGSGDPPTFLPLDH